MKDMVDIYILLTKLGVDKNHMAFRCAAYAAFVALEEKKRLLFSGRDVYPRIAIHCHVGVMTAKRYLRLAAQIAFCENRELLHSMAGFSLLCWPSPKLFLYIIASYLENEEKVC